jgi:hypothetical protein
MTMACFSFRRLQAWALLAACLSAVFVLMGCAHYSAGQQTQLPFQKVYVAPVVNRSLAPQAQALVGEALTQALARTPGLAIAKEPASAHAILSVTLVDYSRLPSIRNPDDTVRALSQDLRLSATYDLLLKKGDRQSTLIEGRRVAATQEAFDIGSYSTAETQAIVPLAQALARLIADQVTAQW